MGELLFFKSMEELTQNQFAELIKNKDEFCQVFSLKGGYLLPDRKFITHEFVRGVLNGSKKLIKQKDVKNLFIPPRVKQISTERMWKAYKVDPQFEQYFPNSKKCPDRHFFFLDTKRCLSDNKDRVADQCRCPTASRRE